MILINQNNIHFQFGYYQPNTKLDYKFQIPNINNNKFDKQNKKNIKNIDISDNNNNKEVFQIFMIKVF